MRLTQHSNCSRTFVGPTKHQPPPRPPDPRTMAARATEARLRGAGQNQPLKRILQVAKGTEHP